MGANQSDVRSSTFSSVIPDSVVPADGDKMHADTPYNCSLKRHCHLTEDGLLSYTIQGKQIGYAPVGLLATKRPIRSKYSNYLEIEIVDPGKECTLSVGIVPPSYGSRISLQPGWGKNSAGYHADDGGIYFGEAHAHFNASKCEAGDRMGVGVIFSGGDSTFFFTRNGEKVFEKSWAALKDGSHHLAVGMHSLGEEARLLDSDMWLSENEKHIKVVLASDIKEVKKHYFSENRHCHLAANGMLSYQAIGNGNVPVALLTTQKTIRPIYSNFLEIEIIDVGKKGTLSVGIVSPNYALGRQPGWNQNSVGYHADDGGIYFGPGSADYSDTRKCKAGDRMGVGVIFPGGDSSLSTTPLFLFTKNGEKVFEKSWAALKDGSHYLAVAMHSLGEKARLLDSDMWLLENEEDLKNLSVIGMEKKTSEIIFKQEKETKQTPDYSSSTANNLTSHKCSSLHSSPTKDANNPQKYEAGVLKDEHSSEDDDLPGFWDFSAANNKQFYQLVPITKTGATFHEYEKIEMQFFETLARDRFKILRIQRIQNPDLYRAFQFCKKRMERRSNTDAIEEKFLFHGTKQKYIEAICHQGFDFRVSGSTTGSLYGRGSYFAKGADYSRCYTDSQQLFVARVLVGHYTTGEPFHKRPPPKDPNHPHGETFDSCVDDLKNPRVFVVFSIEQAYPEYLIDFQKI